MAKRIYGSNALHNVDSKSEIPSESQSVAVNALPVESKPHRNHIKWVIIGLIVILTISSFVIVVFGSHYKKGADDFVTAVADYVTLSVESGRSCSDFYLPDVQGTDYIAVNDLTAFLKMHSDGMKVLSVSVNRDVIPGLSIESLSDGLDKVYGKHIDLDDYQAVSFELQYADNDKTYYFTGNLISVCRNGYWYVYTGFVDIV